MRDMPLMIHRTVEAGHIAPPLPPSGAHELDAGMFWTKRGVYAVQANRINHPNDPHVLGYHWWRGSCRCRLWSGIRNRFNHFGLCKTFSQEEEHGAKC